MARVRILGALRTLRKLRDKIQSLKWRGKFDGQKIENGTFGFSLVGAEVRINTSFDLAGSSHILAATYMLGDQESEEIQFDGADVAEDEVDFDIDHHFLYSKLEYRFRFLTQDGEDHELYLWARVPWDYVI